MTDAFWRNIGERMELHKLAYIDATNTVRSGLRNADGTLKIKDKAAYNNQVEQTYMDLIRHPDDDLLKRAKANTQTALMQKNFSGFKKPLPLIGKNPGKAVEDYKNYTSDYRHGKDWYVNDQGSFGKNLGQSVTNFGMSGLKSGANIADNIPRAFAAQSFAFLRTMTNIFKQYVIERTPFRFLDPEFYGKMSDLERQESLAKIGNGTMILSM